jgi:NADPH2 dehydrogenase
MTDAPTIVKMSNLESPAALRGRLAELGVELALDDEVTGGSRAPLAQPLWVGERRVGNRFAVLPMEGWDATRDGRPTELVRRRWQRFGAGGAKLIWGGEAVSVCREGRAHPHQLLLCQETGEEIAALRHQLVAAHERAHGSSEDLLVGLQLTHSGRFACPEGEPRPRIAYRHPLLDARVGVDSDDSLLADDELDEIVEAFVHAARLAAQAGFDFVDLKHCHGYLGHELLSAVDRPGRYGGSLAGRTHFLRSIVEGIRIRAPGLAIGVRFSAFDFAPFRPGDGGTGVPERIVGGDYGHAFGGTADGVGIDLAEPSALLELLTQLGVKLVCVTAGSPYYNPHIQRPASHPPCDGYDPPEDPLVGVARLVGVAAELKRRHPQLVFVGSGYSYLQEWLPHVAQRAVRDERVDAVGIGRMALSYPELPADVLAGRRLDPKRICRTLSDCTNAPRQGFVSGCYPLDDFYRSRPERLKLVAAKRKAAHRTRS